MKNTKIEWCDSTLNFWSGCTKVSAGCAHCYAETLSNRKLGNIGQWGKGAPRKLHKSAFKQALELNKWPWVCEACGMEFSTKRDGRCEACLEPVHRRRIFSLSLGDWLDPEVPIEWLARMLDTIRQCDQVTWILCTKRPELWSDRLHRAMREACGPADFWISGWLDGHAPKNVQLLTSAENQEAADERIPALLMIPAVVHGLSLEPLLGSVDLHIQDSFQDRLYRRQRGESYVRWFLDWLVVGGESGPGARECEMLNVQDLIRQGRAAGVPVFVKQLGAMAVCGNANMFDFPDDDMVVSYGEAAASCRLMTRHPKGGDMAEWPEELRVRQFPEV